MKIVHISLLGVFSEKYAYQDNLLSKYHKRLGHEVTIMAPTYTEFNKDTGRIESSPKGEYLLENGIRLIRLAPLFPQRINGHIIAFKGFRTVLNALHPDLIFAHSVSVLNFRYLKKYKDKHPNVQIVFDNHVDLINSCHNWFTYNYNRFFIRYFIVKRIEGISNYFYGVTPARCDFLHDMYGIPRTKISLLPLGADDDEMDFENKAKIRSSVRGEYGICDDDFLIVTGGKIDPLKNIHVLTEAISNSKNKRIKLLVFGSIRDDLKGVFERLSSDRIKCIGWIPSNRVYHYFYAADLVIFPGLHSVLWEQAVASQIPCAFSKIPGFEHINIGENCVLMEGKTSEYYQKLVEQIVSDREFYAQLLKNAQSPKSSIFLYSHIANKVIEDINVSIIKQ